MANFHLVRAVAPTSSAQSSADNSDAMAFVAYFLSRIAFLLAHAVFAAWIVFVTNDPFNFRDFAPRFFNTLDVDKDRVVEGSDIDWAAARFDALVFLCVWWIPHSGLSRNVVKRALGLGPEHPLDRPIFAFLAPICWWGTMALWKPITASSRMDVTEITLAEYLWRAPIVLTFLFECLGLFYLLPNHVFGTDRHKWAKGDMPKDHKLIVSFPYSLVRHPAAAFFLWMYWVGIPNYNANHLLLASLWTVFIVIGTLVFEEGGLKDHEFKKEYSRYSDKVNAFIPSVWSIKMCLGLLKDSEKWKEE